ncbi:MAG: hypothetical protein WC067_01645 [Candidatus Methanomethylophilaceae archaeon]
MRLNKKAECEFMGAMIAVMVITITLTAFIGLLSYISVSDTTETADIETDYLSKLSIKNENIVGDIQSDLQEQIYSKNYKSIRLTVKTIGMISEDIFSAAAGEEKTDNVISKIGTLILQSDDGRRLAASYEVVVWI